MTAAPSDSDGGPPGDPRPPENARTVAFAALGYVLGGAAGIFTLMTELLTGAGKVAVIVLTSLLIVVATLATVRSLDMTWRGIAGTVPVWVRWLIGVLALAATVIAVLAWADTLAEPECPGPVDVVVLAPVDDLDDVSREFEALAAEAVDADGCRTIRAVTTGADRAAAGAALAAGWGQDALRDIGPRPDVWITESETDLTVVVERLGEGLAPPMPSASASQAGSGSGSASASASASDGEPAAPSAVFPARAPEIDGRRAVTLGVTPLVVAVSGPDELTIPDPDTGALVSARDRLLDTPELVDLAADSGRVILRAAPERSASALHHTFWSYGGADPDTESARTAEQHVAVGRRALPHVPVDGDAALLCGLPQDGEQEVAVLTTERRMTAYDDGGCATGSEPRRQLVGYYPRSGDALKLQATPVSWPPLPGDAGRAASAERRAAVDALLRRVRDAAHGDLPTRLRLRPLTESASAPLHDLGRHRAVVDDDRLARQVFLEAVDEVPDTAALGRTLDEHGRERQTVRVQVMLDASGSMLAEDSQIDRRRWGTGALGVADVLARIGPADQFGLSTFAGPAGESPVEAFPFRSDWTPEVVRARLREMRLDGRARTPLFDAVTTALDTFRTTDPGTSPADRPADALVLLTDGRDTSDGSTTFDDALDAAAGADARIHVLTIGGMTCEETRLDKIAAASGGTCATARNDDELHAEVSDIFSLLWGSDER